MATYIKETTNDELYHHGIRGQRWGVRRYQNEDGSLTPEGRRQQQQNTNQNTSKSNGGDDTLTNMGKSTVKTAAIFGAAALGTAYVTWALGNAIASRQINKAHNRRAKMTVKGTGASLRLIRKTAFVGLPMAALGGAVIGLNKKNDNNQNNNDDQKR